MSSRGRILFLAFIFAWFFIFPVKALAYDTNVAHPNIASLAADLYNQNFSEKLTAEEIDWIKQGAVDEDTPTRWLNHFYDPVYNLGLRGSICRPRIGLAIITLSVIFVGRPELAQGFG